MSTADLKTVRLQVSLFGHLRQTNQQPALTLDIPAGTTVQDMLWALAEMLGENFQRAIFDSAGNLHGGIEVVLNEEHLPARKISALTVQQDGNLYLIPMIEGG
jgi:hypothetical protein